MIKEQYIAEALACGAYCTLDRLEAFESLDDLRNNHQDCYVWALGNMPGFLADMIRAGADVNIKDNEGCTPLHWATRRGQVACMAALIQAGANIEAVNDHGMTPLNIAVRHCSGACAELLRRSGAKEDG